MIEWLQAREALLWWMASGSVAGFFVSLAVVYWFLVLIPADYFLSEKPQPTRLIKLHPVSKWTLRIVKNLLGYVLLVAGILMLFLPGQGLLTILVAVMLLDFPGKYRLERRMVAYPGVKRSIDWLRRKAGRPPLIVDP
ncbi:MAG TPA: PGPGW domain-containing protein [Burkholderiales bacterium]|nr:PGPGW domain-containing protein [Burkholderiales bacterium]